MHWESKNAHNTAMKYKKKTLKFIDINFIYKLYVIVFTNFNAIGHNKINSYLIFNKSNFEIYF